MKRRRVSFRRRAEAALFALYDYIAREGGIMAAGGYIARIEETCLSLETFPERGTPRDDIRPGMRLLGFERRVLIAYQVIRSEVVILRILYGGQDYRRALRGRRQN